MSQIDTHANHLPVPPPANPSAHAGAVPLEAPDFLPISYLNALLYCPRRFYLEYAYGEMLVNEHVLQGRISHRTADSGATRTTDTGLTLRSVYVYSDRLRIAGLIDVIEAPIADGESLPSAIGAGSSPSEQSRPLRFYPIEYKKGSARGGGQNDRVQLCAQGLCLEERTSTRLDGGFLFSFGTRHRTWIPFDGELRALTEDAITRAFALLREGCLPPPLPAEQERKCTACSLKPLCLPREVRALQAAQSRG